jgi:hypothetical protein
MFHSWLMGTERSTTPIIRDEDLVRRNMASPSNRNSEMPEFAISGTSLNSIYQPDMDWSLNPTMMSMPELSAGHVNLDILDQVIDTTQLDTTDSICWLERSASRSVQGDANPSTQREIAAITAGEGAEFLTRLSFAMKQSEQNTSANWDALRNANRLPNILERRETANISERLKENFMWLKIVSYATDFASSILPPFIHQMYLLKDPSRGIHDFANLPEPLSNCRSIVPMYLQKTPSCKNLVLKTLLLEVQRLHNEV